MSLYSRDGKRKHLNVSERLNFYESTKQILDLEQQSFLLTLFYTGCRISEALSLRPNDIEHSDGTLIFRTLKQRNVMRYRALPIPEELLAKLGRVSPNDGKLWSFSRTTAWRRVKDQMKMTGLDGIKATPKGLRHGFAIASVSEGVPITTVQKWLGHALPRTTSIYLDFVGEDERALARRIWPKNR